MARKGKGAGESRYLPCRTHAAGEGLSLRRENPFEFPGYALVAPERLSRPGCALVAPGRPTIRVMRCGARDTADAFITVRWGTANLEALCCFAGKSAYFRTEKPNAGHRKTAMRRAFIHKNVGSQGADAHDPICKAVAPRGSAGDRTGGFIRFVYWGAANLETLCCPVGESAALQGTVLHGKTLRYKAAALQGADAHGLSCRRLVSKGDAALRASIP